MSSTDRDEPELISVSGGRSSGLMLRMLLDQWGGQLPPSKLAIFANTGEEAEGTLIFVREIAERWSVPIRWVEFQREPVPGAAFDDIAHFREVDYCTASRKGEPFDAMIDWKRYLPNPTQRLCTTWLKVRAALGLAASLGFPIKRVDTGKPGKPRIETFADFDQHLGIRADEPRRVAKNRPKPDVRMPLVDAGITRADVLAFWRAQPFDLAIRPGEGNCVDCFEKGLAQLVNVARAAPDDSRIERWIAREDRIGSTVRKGRSYSDIRDIARRQLPMLQDDPGAETELLPCACGD